MPQPERPQYQLPPKVIADLIDAPPAPVVSIHSVSRKTLFLHRPNLPSIDEVAVDELRLAGVRLNPRTTGGSRVFYFDKLFIQQDGKQLKVRGIPARAKIQNVSWSSDGERLAFTVTRARGIELWVAEGEPFTARKLTGIIINDTLGNRPFRWLSDNETIVCKTVPGERGKVPTPSRVPQGPIIQENTARKTAHRTYQDVLKNEHDAALFEYYTCSQLIRINIKTGRSRKLNKPAIIAAFSPSPDGNYIRVAQVERPFSYVVPYSRFAKRIELWNRDGKRIKTLAEIPVADDIPQGFDAVRTGPRSFCWRNDHPATLYWVEAQDGGDPRSEVDIRDQVFCLEAPFDGESQKSIATKMRFSSFEWGTGKLAIVEEWQWKDRRIVTSRFAPDAPEKDQTVLFDHSWEDRYNDPGSFQTHSNEYGKHVLMQNKKGKLFLIGEGASPEGNRPFIDLFDVKKRKTKRLFQSEAPNYEIPMKILDTDNQIIITSRESNNEPANYFIKNLKKGKETQVSHFPHPYPHLKKLSPQLLEYKRKDGIKLRAKLYLPVNYNKKKDGRLPVLMWAYPREYKSADAAGQMKDSPYRFTRLYAHSPLYWVMQGYAVVEGFGMPIVGEGDVQPNEKFVAQIRANAKAAIKKIVKMGIADPNRIAVGGHSYGAFMTANLLAHTNLFAAGIARSGAYNRTLTPFGFQSEERNFWEATETYMQMSPFTNADKINAPLLLIHGEADANSGTYPMQSERFYSALKGLGKTVRLSILPKESHGYRARESVMHMLWEMTEWLDKYVKNKV